MASGDIAETGRMQELQDVFKQHDLHFVGIAESRCKKQKVRS